MKSPLLISVGNDAWLTEQIRSIAAESRWLFQSCSAEVLDPRDPRPTVVLLAADPRSPAAALTPLAAVHRVAPDVAVAVLTASKITEGDRADWLALLLDLGARAVLFPPYTRLVLDDLIGGLMASCARRSGFSLDRARTPKAMEPELDGAIDLAGGDYEEPA